MRADVSVPALKGDIAIPAQTELWRDTQSAAEEAPLILGGCFSACTSWKNYQELREFCGCSFNMAVDDFDFNLCCTVPVSLQASLNHFLRGRCWPCACFCVLGTGPELQESSAVTAVTKTRSCTISVAGEAQCSSPVFSLGL